MNPVGRMRLSWTIQTYDFWLDLRGTGGKRRRELCRELRANVLEAAADTDIRTAVENLGNARVMAAEAVPRDTTRVRWSAGFQVAFTVALLTLIVECLVALSWLDGVMAAHPTHIVRGSLLGFPGSSVEHDPSSGDFALNVNPGWTFLATGFFGWVVVARPWRLLRTLEHVAREHPDSREP